MVLPDRRHRRPAELAAGAAAIRASSSRCRCRAAAASCGRTIQASFVAAFLRLRTLLASPDVRAERDDAHDGVLVEGFIAGWEFALEGLLHHGALYVLALFDKPDPLDGPFFEETIYVTPSLAPRADAARHRRRDCRAAAAPSACAHGPIHAECRVDDRGVFVLEVAARPIGGLCAACAAVREARVARATRVRSRSRSCCCVTRSAKSPDDWRREAAASGVMMIPIPQARASTAASTGVEAAGAVPGVDDVRITAKPDQQLMPLPEGASYLGFIFARGDDAGGDVEQALRDAHARLRFADRVPRCRMSTIPHG